MYDIMVSTNDGGSFLPNTLRNPSVVGSECLSTTSSKSSLGGSTNSNKKSRRKGVRRSVSFSSDGPNIQHVDTVHSILKEELPQEEDLQASLNNIWYDSCELATVQQASAQLIVEDELSLAGGETELEEKVGDTLRGLERQTEQGSWQHFQNRAKALGAVLDTRSQDADELASLATEATEEARSEAQKRAKRDEKEALAYLSDVRGSLLLSNSVNSISFQAGSDDASVLSGSSEEDLWLEGEDSEDETLQDNKFANIKSIDGGKRWSSSKSPNQKTGSSNRGSRRKSAPSKLDLSCPITTLNKPENAIASKKKNAPPPETRHSLKMDASITALSLVDDEIETMNDNVKNAGLVQIKDVESKAKTTAIKKLKDASATSLSVKDEESNADAKAAVKAIKKTKNTKDPLQASGTSLSVNDEESAQVNAEVDAKAAIKAIKKSKKKSIRRSRTLPKEELGLDLSCPVMSMNKPEASATSSSMKDHDDEDKIAAPKPVKKTPKRRISRSKTLPEKVTSFEDASIAPSSVKDEIDDSIVKPRRRSSNVLETIAKMNQKPNDQLPSMFVAAQKSPTEAPDSSKSSVTSTATPKSSSAPKKILLPSNSSRRLSEKKKGPLPRSNSMGNPSSLAKKNKFPTNGSRASVGRIPRRKVVAGETSKEESEEPPLARTLSSVN